MDIFCGGSVLLTTLPADNVVLLEEDSRSPIGPHLILLPAHCQSREPQGPAGGGGDRYRHHSSPLRWSWDWVGLCTRDCLQRALNKLTGVTGLGCGSSQRRGCRRTPVLVAVPGNWEHLSEALQTDLQSRTFQAGLAKLCSYYWSYQALQVLVSE